MRCLKVLARSFDRFWFLILRFPGLYIHSEVGQEEMRREHELTTPPDWPQEPLPHSDLSEEERREALRQYEREMEEKGNS